MDNRKKIYSLIYKHLIRQASDDELRDLELWRKQDASNEAMYQKIIKHERINASFKVYTSVDTDAAFTKIMAPKGKKKGLLLTFLKYAAVIAIPIVLGLSIWLLSKQQQASESISEVIVPVSQKALVVLSDGSTVELANENSSVLLKEEGVVVGKDSLNTLAYTFVESNELIYNTIKIPYGGEYHLILSDGTRVWLNSGSSLKFPVNFIGEKREVSLQGEAYFEVVRNSEKPFIVRTGHSTTRVYGTSFNVMCYEDDMVEQVTLIEGKVGFNINGKQTLLHPGQQVELSLNNSKVEVKKVDTSIYTSWTGGVLKFKNMPIRELAKKLTRWYDVDFYFANSSVEEINFTGRIEKTADFKYFMSLIEKTTNVKISVDGRNVMIEEVK
ncbi:FecR family protein [Saccharicrinis carchari]|uniref:FecR family protein n=1 Tax=Saccharicrinis carchari TaxID=1168039 RepID=A0A521C8I8_SACCC|nr:FecR domain-containing protein [Saccharicrinis carchari]SMO55030.1 FecR family protein [Saccharicrinis carchari]